MKLLKTIYKLWLFCLTWKAYKINGTKTLVGHNKATFTIEFKRAE